MSQTFNISFIINKKLLFQAQLGPIKILMFQFDSVSNKTPICSSKLSKYGKLKTLEIFTFFICIISLKRINLWANNDLLNAYIIIIKNLNLANFVLNFISMVIWVVICIIKDSENKLKSGKSRLHAFYCYHFLPYRKFNIFYSALQYKR